MIFCEFSNLVHVSIVYLVGVLTRIESLKDR